MQRQLHKGQLTGPTLVQISDIFFKLFSLDRCLLGVSELFDLTKIQKETQIMIPNIFIGTICQLYGITLLHFFFLLVFFFILKVFAWVYSYLFWMFIKTCWCFAIFAILCETSFVDLGTVLNQWLSGSQKSPLKVLVIGTSTYIPSRGQGPDICRDGMTICLFLVVPHGWLSNVRKACLLYLFWGQVKDFSTTHLVPGLRFFIIFKIICLPPPSSPWESILIPCHSYLFQVAP